ncbi:hypothetical protein [Citrobacter youngae]|uniref:hypothetical protein n=1 Tax=Citrobacter youngae TaxID=133448 RepID=UPI000BFDC6E4|nr:hypothetical protein [Citrobacter youngae]PHH11820.1 hypothetical protein CRX54_29255 [Klebsiella oxytoca]
MSTNNLRFVSLLFIFIISMIVIFRGESLGIKVNEELIIRFLIFISLPFSLVKAKNKKKDK